MNSIILPLLLTTAAGLATGIGGLIGICVRKPGKRFLAFVMGFSAGVMIHISFVELMEEAIEDIGFGWSHIYFFLGMGLMFLIDVLVPHDHGLGKGGMHHSGEEIYATGARDDFHNTDNILRESMPHEEHSDEDVDEHEKARLERTGLLVVVGIAIHNFPEGIAVFIASLENINVGVALAVAVGLHNIPEGIAVAAPIHAATGNRGKAFLWSLFSGLLEPLGALIAAVILAPFMSEVVLGATFAAVAGIMVFVALDELLPSATRSDKGHLSIIGVILGMIIMAASLWLFDLLL